MSASKLQVGTQIKIEYEGNWYYANIIEMTNINIVIKLWKNGYKTKLFDIPRKPNWINLVIEKKIYDMTNYKNQIFPQWVKFRQNVCIIDKFKEGDKYYIISDFVDGKYIEFTGINNDSQQLQLKTIKYCQEKIFLSETYSDSSIKIPSLDITIKPEYHNINNRILMKKLASIQRDKYKSNTKSTKKTVKKICEDDMRHYKIDQFVEDSSKKYKNLLINNGNGIFPDEINEIILSFVSEKIIFLCPPSRCIKKDIKYFGPTTNSRFIGCEFKIKTNVKICGFRLYDDNLILKAYDMHFTAMDKKISKYGDAYIIKGENNDYCTDFIFDKAMILKGKRCRFLLTLDLSERETEYSWHEIKKFEKIGNWKIFKYMRWMEYQFFASTEENERYEANFKYGVITPLFKLGRNWSTQLVDIKVFPHIAIILAGDE